MTMETINLSLQDRALLSDLVNELRRLNDKTEKSTQDRLVSCSEAAVIIGRTRQTVSKWIRDGRLHKVVRGCRSGILLSELNQTKPFAS